MTLIISPSAAKQLTAMPRQDAARIFEALNQVAANPDFRFSFVTELVGLPGVWRLRKGDWRVTFAIENGDVIVDRIGHRREIYK